MFQYFFQLTELQIQDWWPWRLCCRSPWDSWRSKQPCTNKYKGQFIFFKICFLRARVGATFGGRPSWPRRHSTIDRFLQINRSNYNSSFNPLYQLITLWIIGWMRQIAPPEGVGVGGADRSHQRLGRRSKSELFGRNPTNGGSGLRQ